ncbi:hypothetical protein D9M69_492790 [compost metagenome]
MRPLLGRLRGRRGGAERRVDPPGTGVRFAHQHGRALRQGRRAARARPRRIPPEVPDEAGQRQVPAHRLGPGARRDLREDEGDPPADRPGFAVLRRLVQAQQRAVLPAAQVGVVLRHQQHRPPGAHLPLDHRGGCGQYLGLRCDDELVQRHAELEGCAVYRLERSRGAPGIDAAPAPCQGKRLQGDRGRSPLHAHRGQGASLCAHPLGHRHRLPVRGAVPRLQERLGRQEVPE